VAAYYKRQAAQSEVRTPTASTGSAVVDAPVGGAQSFSLCPLWMEQRSCHPHLAGLPRGCGVAVSPSQNWAPIRPPGYGSGTTTCPSRTGRPRGRPGCRRTWHRPPPLPASDRHPAEQRHRDSLRRWGRPTLRCGRAPRVRRIQGKVHDHASAFDRHHRFLIAGARYYVRACQHGVHSDQEPGANRPPIPVDDPGDRLARAPPKLLRLRPGTPGRRWRG
jgi:hypothetical protein